MGGSIAIAARFNDGQAICIDGWTNFIPRMVMNATTLSGDDSVVRSMLMEAAAHPSYAGPCTLRGHGYGMFVIDFVDRTIHSKQSYTSFGEKFLNEFLDLKQTGWREGPDGPHFVQVLSESGGSLIDAGRVAKSSIDREPCPSEKLDRAMILEMLRQDFVAFFSEAPKTFIGVTVDMAPFVVIDYPDDGTLNAMKDHLREAGFPMTKGEGLNAILAGIREPRTVTA